MAPTNIPGRCRLWGEARRRDGGTEGQRDSCPPASAGRDQHAPRHARASDLADAGICRRRRALPALLFARVFAGTMASAHCKGRLFGLAVFFIYYYYFSFVFVSLLSFGTPLSCPWPQDIPDVHSTAAFSSLPALTCLPKIGSGNLDFPGEAACQRGESRPTAPSKQEWAISLMCLVSLLPFFKPTYESNEGADSRGEAPTAQHY